MATRCDESRDGVEGSSEVLVRCVKILNQLFSACVSVED